MASLHKETPCSRSWKIKIASPLNPIFKNRIVTCHHYSTAMTNIIGKALDVVFDFKDRIFRTSQELPFYFLKNMNMF